MCGEPRCCSAKVRHYRCSLNMDTPCGVVEVDREGLGHASVVQGELQEQRLLNTLVCHLVFDFFEMEREG